MKKQFMLKKIPLDSLLTILTELYEQGADYIDISGKHDDEKDEISITVREEYYSEEYDEIQFTEEKNTPFSDLDINELL